MPTSWGWQKRIPHKENTMADNVSDTLRRHAAAMTEQGFPDKAAALSEAADLVDEVGIDKAKEILGARVREAADPAHANRVVGEKALLISFALQWLCYDDR
jgi:hypothetical protein